MKVDCRKNWRYLLLALAVTAFILLIFIWLPNLSFGKTVILSPSFSASRKLSIFISYLGFLKTGFLPLGRVLVILTAVLFGVNVSLLVFFFKYRQRSYQKAGLSLSGLFSGLIGVGCSSCGSIILSSLFGLAATAGFISALPLGGQEFGFLSVVMLGLSIFLISRKLANPEQCRNN